MTLAYDDAGRGLPVVLLHAFPLDRSMWSPVRVALTDVCRVVTPDLPGFGATPAVPFTVDSAADLVRNLMDELQIRSAVVGGLSMGGYVALAFARRHPDRLAGLILADTKSEPDDDTARHTRDRTIGLARDQGPAAVIDGMLPKMLAPDHGRSRPEVAAYVRGVASSQSVEGLTHALVALRDRPDATPGLADIRVPTLVLVGEHDVITPPAGAKAMADRIAGAKYVVIPGVGHLSSRENPELFGGAVRDFLTGAGMSPV